MKYILGRYIVSTLAKESEKEYTQRFVCRRHDLVYVEYTLGRRFKYDEL